MNYYAIIFDEHGLDTNRNTMCRTIQFVAKFSSEKLKEERDPEDHDNLITLTTDGSKLILIADQDEWVAYMSQVSEHLEAKKRARQDDDWTRLQSRTPSRTQLNSRKQQTPRSECRRTPRTRRALHYRNALPRMSVTPPPPQHPRR